MIVLQVNPSGLERTVVDEEKNKVTAFLKSEAEAKRIQMTTFLIQVCSFSSIRSVMS